MQQGGPHRAGRADHGRSGERSEAIDERLLVREAGDVARRGMRQDDDGGLRFGERPRWPLDPLEVGSRPRFHAGGRAARSRALAGIEP